MERFSGQSVFSWWFAKRLLFLAAGAALFAWALGLVMSHAVTATGGARAGEGPAWAAPEHIAIRRIGPLGKRQNTPVLFSNLDCTPVTYRLVSGYDMQTGCFTETVFGMLDSDDHTVIFNGTDEGQPLEAYTAHQVLAPWPKTEGLLSLSPLSTDGALVGVYKQVLASIQDLSGNPGRPDPKRLAATPDTVLKDPSGKPLIINPQTLAFSQGGNWMVAEALTGSFVRLNPGVPDSITPFAPSYGSTGSPALLKSQVAVSEDGRWVAIANGYGNQFKVYDLRNCGPADRNSSRDLPPLDCPSHDYWSYAASKIPELRNVRRVRFVNDGLLSFEALSSDSSHSGVYELAPAPDITSLADYIGLGDSYTSGEGAFDYLLGTDTPDNTCHLAVNSYPLLLARDLFGAGGHSAACSGAVIDDIGSTSGNYRGQVKDGASLDELRRSHPQALESIEAGFLPGYIAQHRFVRRWQPRITTVSIAGNDIGFGDMLRNCVAPHISLNRSDNTCYGTYEDRLELKNLIDRTVPRWEALFDQLKREAPGTRLYVIGYPQIAMSSGDCGLNVRLDRDELKLAEEIIDYINHGVREAADRTGADYVDISKALYGHRLCEAKGDDIAMNGLTAGDDSGVAGVGLLGRESYHPNALGQKLMEQAIIQQTHGFAESESTADQSSGEQGDDKTTALLDAPATGRTVYDLVPDRSLVPEAARRGSEIRVEASGAKDGLRPSTIYTLRMDGPSGKVLGT
ncbi:MAG TPA: SGNH/GDSL hydrolase family protein, partial [Candidatus Saccharimonadales bacterium]|nr:SGNH/GDSL hydrolase family protein [Candidatus Saccharimonadales bacterium]